MRVSPNGKRGTGRKRAGIVAIAAAATAMLAALVSAPSADAYRLGGKRWPGRTIPYYSSATQYALSVNQAVAGWNASGARIRFVRVTRARAKVIIRVARSAWGEAGSASLGYTWCTSWIIRSGQRRCIRPFIASVRLSPGYDRFEMAQTAAHELGHILGLDHEDRRCAVMNSAGNALGGERCQDDLPENFEGKWRCRIIELDDARGAVRRYGGRPRAVRPDPICWKFPPPPAPLELAAITDPPSGGYVLLQWRNSSALRAGSKVVVARRKDACPTSTQGSDASWDLNVTPGTSSTSEDIGEPALPAGRHCYALWTLDETGQRSAEAVVWVDILDIPPPTELVAITNPNDEISVLLRWRNTTHARVDDIEIARKRDACATDRLDPAVSWLTHDGPVQPGQVSEAYDRAWLETGRFCYSVWSRDSRTGRFSPQPATVIVD